MNHRIDLHVHSSYSDGTLSPSELVALAVKRNVCAFALTDHDTTDGIKEAMVAAKPYQIEIIPGVELSTNYFNKDIHILGLGIDWMSPSFGSSLVEFQESRDVRNLKMIAKLQHEGVSISYDQMLSAFPDSVWTRAHFARFLKDHGYVQNMWDAFSEYIGDHAPCFVPREKVTPYQAIELIHKGKGWAILAHPLLYSFTNPDLDHLVQQLKLSGLDGLEAMYSMNRHMEESNMKVLAKKYDLKISGGSDFHGSNKPNIQLGTGKGNLNISYDIWRTINNC
ncbi:MAG: PHP domain-containing protein [Lachnospiraceae bacterium]